PDCYKLSHALHWYFGSIPAQRLHAVAKQEGARDRLRRILAARTLFDPVVDQRLLLQRKRRAAERHALAQRRWVAVDLVDQAADQRRARNRVGVHQCVDRVDAVVGHVRNLRTGVAAGAAASHRRVEDRLDLGLPVDCEVYRHAAQVVAEGEAAGEGWHWSDQDGREQQQWAQKREQVQVAFPTAGVRAAYACFGGWRIGVAAARRGIGRADRMLTSTEDHAIPSLTRHCLLYLGISFGFVFRFATALCATADLDARPLL